MRARIQTIYNDVEKIHIAGQRAVVERIVLLLWMNGVHIAYQRREDAQYNLDASSAEADGGATRSWFHNKALSTSFLVHSS